uniref:Uncharacterized protein n=1 Tax=Romanomermis culicivorax TaxID=13658 RepID=A0A915IS79_ROMCU
MTAKSPGKFKVPRLSPAKRQPPTMQQPSTLTSQRLKNNSLAAPLAVAQRIGNRGKLRNSQTRPHTRVDWGMAKVKPEEVSEGALSDPTGAQETGNMKAKTWTHNFTIQISNHLLDAVEANKARTRARMEYKTNRCTPCAWHYIK